MLRKSAVEEEKPLGPLGPLAAPLKALEPGPAPALVVGALGLAYLMHFIFFFLQRSQLNKARFLFSLGICFRFLDEVLMMGVVEMGMVEEGINGGADECEFEVEKALFGELMLVKACVGEIRHESVASRRCWWWWKGYEKAMERRCNTEREWLE